jgi:hypothetical protein
MATIIADLQNLYRRASSKTITSKSEIASANVGSKDYYIHSGVRISISVPRATAVVIRPFVIEVTPTEEGYLATSRVSTVFELEATPGQAVTIYLQSLLDELVWLQKQEEHLSPAIQEELYLLQNYLKIV